MSITLNGETAVFQDIATVADLVAALGVVPQRVAIELNETIVRRSEYRATPIREGDRIEIVTLVGGG